MNCIKIRCAERINLSGCWICRYRICVINYADWIRSASQLNMFDEILIIWVRCLEQLHIRLFGIGIQRRADQNLFISCYRCLCKIDFIFRICTFDLHRCEREISLDREVCSFADIYFSCHINIGLISPTCNRSAWQVDFIKVSVS